MSGHTSGNTKVKSTRNNILDLLRGHFLLAILITHFYKFPSPYIFYFGRGEMWVSSAPGFVFISGLVIGMISKRRIGNEGIKSAIKKIFNRGFKLYIVSCALTIGYTLVALKIGSWQYLNYGLLNASVPEIVLKTLIFQYSYGWADLLLYYSVMLMFVSPIVLYLVYKGMWKLLLGGSFLLWLAVYLYPGTTKFTGSYIPVESWQFLFVTAMLCGYYKDKIAPAYRKYFFNNKKRFFRLIYFAGIILTIGLSIADRFYDLFDGKTEVFLDTILIKRELGPGLLFMFFYWFTALYYIFQKFELLIAKWLGWLFIPFGKNSLLTYTVQSVYLFIQFYLPLPNSYWWNTLTTTVLIMLVWLTVKIILQFQKSQTHSSFLPK